MTQMTQNALTSAQDPIAGIGLKIMAMVVFSVMGAMVKGMGDTYPIGQIVFFRSFFALIPVFIWIKLSGDTFSVLKTTRPQAHAVRSTIGGSAMFLSFWSLTLLPLADATAFGYVAPLFTTALAALYLREAVGVYRWTAVLFGFSGVLFIVQPQGGVGTEMIAGIVPLGVVVALSAAFLVGTSAVIIRHLTSIEHATAIVFYFSAACSVFGAVSMLFVAVWPSWTDLMILSLIGLLGGAGQILITNGIRLAPASLLAPFDYTTMIWALLIGYFVFSEVPKPMVLMGAAIIIGSGLFILWRERKRNVQPSNILSLGNK